MKGGIVWGPLRKRTFKRSRRTPKLATASAPIAKAASAAGRNSAASAYNSAMPTELETAVKRLRAQGYKLEQVPAGAVSADGYILLYTVGEGLASGDDIIRISNGLDHVPAGPDYEVGQAVQLLTPLMPPANIPAGAVATIEAVWSREVTICKGNKLVRVDLSAIRAFPLPEVRKRKR